MGFARRGLPVEAGSVSDFSENKGSGCKVYEFMNASALLTELVPCNLKLIYADRSLLRSPFGEHPTCQEDCS